MVVGCRLFVIVGSSLLVFIRCLLFVVDRYGSLFVVCYLMCVVVWCVLLVRFVLRRLCVVVRCLFVVRCLSRVVTCRL